MEVGYSVSPGNSRCNAASVAALPCSRVSLSMECEYSKAGLGLLASGFSLSACGFGSPALFTEVALGQEKDARGRPTRERFGYHAAAECAIEALRNAERRIAGVSDEGQTSSAPADSAAVHISSSANR